MIKLIRYTSARLVVVEQGNVQDVVEGQTTWQAQSVAKVVRSVPTHSQYQYRAPDRKRIRQKVASSKDFTNLLTKLVKKSVGLYIVVIHNYYAQLRLKVVAMPPLHSS